MQVWVLRNKETGDFLPPIDDDGTSVFMAWPTQDEAIAGLSHQVGRNYITPDEYEPMQLTWTLLANIPPSRN